MQGGTVQTKKANPEQVLECQVKENEEIIKGQFNRSDFGNLQTLISIRFKILELHGQRIGNKFKGLEYLC